MKKYKRKQVEVQCSCCKKFFFKDESEVKRNLSVGRSNFCSRVCVGKSNISNFGDNTNRDTSYLRTLNRGDEYTPFRTHLRRAKRRDLECNLDLEYLRSIWNKQQGICPYSKVKLCLASESKFNNPIYTMSLDRINSNLGYIKGNVQFVSITVNYMKNVMTGGQVKEFIDILKNTVGEL